MKRYKRIQEKDKKKKKSVEMSDKDDLKKKWIKISNWKLDKKNENKKKGCEYWWQYIKK